MHSDQVLQKSVLETLAWEPGVPATHSGVAVEDGVVTLAGHVESFAQKHAAASATWGAPGTTSVENNIILA